MSKVDVPADVAVPVADAAEGEFTLERGDISLTVGEAWRDSEREGERDRPGVCVRVAAYLPRWYLTNQS